MLSGLAMPAMALGWMRTAPAQTAAAPEPAGNGLERLESLWRNPPRSCRPHTRWWWPGNAITHERVRQELSGMKANGIGGVELCSIWQTYEKGNIPYLSKAWLEMVRFAIETAKSLDMEFALTMGAGWDFGGFWVPAEQRSKCLACGWVDLDGGTTFDGELPGYVRPKDKGRIPWIDEQPLLWTAPDHNQVRYCVAARLDGERLDEAALIDLSPRVQRNGLSWQVPPGRWRLMAFRLLYTGQRNSAHDYEPEHWVIDHYNRQAVHDYCAFLGNTFLGAFGEHFGNTVDSFFSDSFEVVPLWNTVLWSNALMDSFRAANGYDFTRFLPSIWFDVGDNTPRLRYDLNQFLHQTVIETFFAPFREWCEQHHIQARLQPHYRFADEVIEGAGAVQRPETEISTARFESIPDPRKATVSGARFYGREFVSCEAYTFLHRERYRTTLEEMKRATDAFLRDGVTQFYNHGYLSSAETLPVPSRDFVATTRVSHWNTWWRYYGGLADYIARCCAVLREGTFVGDVLLFSPHAAFWSEKALFEIERRYQNYGSLPRVLLSSGYDYDLVNDDLLLRQAEVRDGAIEIRGHRYPALVLPGCEWMLPETAEKILTLVRNGARVFAVDLVPLKAPGYQFRQERDQRVRQAITALFAPSGGRKDFPNGGASWFLPDYQMVKPPLVTNEVPHAPQPALAAAESNFLAALSAIVPPAVRLPGGKPSTGLCHIQRRIQSQTGGEHNLFFVTNLQPDAVDAQVSFRVTDCAVSVWNPITGEIRPFHQCRQTPGYTELRLRMEPWNSAIFLFSPAPRETPSVTATTLSAVHRVDATQVQGLAAISGPHTATVITGGRPRQARGAAALVPTPVEIAGPWTVEFRGNGPVPAPLREDVLRAWNEVDSLKSFSGTGVYQTDFSLDAPLLDASLEWTLDAGRVGDIAELWLNGQRVGVRWMQPYRLPVTGLLRAGANALRIDVTNTLMPYVAAMKQNPPVPEALRAHYGDEAVRFPDPLRVATREFGFQPLPVAGLLGPVRLIAQRRVTLRLG